MASFTYIILEQGDIDVDAWQPKWLVNVAAALEQSNRICHIGLYGVPPSQMGEILAAMHKPFPVLKYLNLESEDETVLVEPDLFLGGSASCLEYLQLATIPFPGLPELLSSATHLTDLRIKNISRSGYISPEEIVSCFPALTRLQTLILDFGSPGSFPIREHPPRPPPPTPTRTLLPALTSLRFRGVSEYLERLVAWIDTPRPLLDTLMVYLFRIFTADTDQLAQFVNCAPKLKAHDDAHVVFHHSTVHLKLGRVFQKGLRISCGAKSRQVSSAVQICTSSLDQAFIATLERLYIYDNFAYGQEDILTEKNHWLELLRPFTSVKSLYLTQEIVPRIAPALQELFGESAVGVLPALQTLFLENLNLSGPAQEAIGSYVSGREFSSHPVTFALWESNWTDRYM